MTINERIRTLRKDGFDMNMEEFGILLGISKSGVSEIESGRRNVTDQHIKMLTVAPIKSKKVSEDWLRTGEGEMFLQMDPEDELMDWAGRVLAAHPHDFRKRFVKMLMGLSDEQWHIMEAKILELAAQYDDEDNKKED